jgi:hypothetical protein
MKHFFKNLFYFSITIIICLLIMQTLINSHKENIKTELNTNY